MNQNDIRVGKTYVNADAGTTRRTVLYVECRLKRVVDYRCRNKERSKPVLYVAYEQEGIRKECTLKVFARWAGSEATNEQP